MKTFYFLIKGMICICSST